MKNTIKYLAIAAALVLGLASCTKKAPEYQPAPAVGNAEVFFAPNQPTTVNLKGNEGVISVGVKRVQTASSLTATISSTSPSLFTVPSSVTFDAGAATAVLNITFQPASLEEEVEYAFNLTITSDTTPYGAAEYNFIATIPASWNTWRKGTLHEEPYWGEIETKTLYYQELSSELLLCKFEDCFGHDTGPTYPVQDYVFYWNTKTNRLYIPVQWMGYENSNGLTWFSDEPAFYNLYWAMKNGAGYGAGTFGPGAGQVEGSAEWFEFCDAFRDAYPEDYYPYYDGNGGFYLADQYIAGYPGDASVYLGRYVAGDAWDYFIADGFVRKTDYNGEKYFGASSALYEGYAESWMLSNDASYPYEFEASMRYDASYLDSAKLDEDGNFDVNAKENQDLTTTYYIANYFGEDQCLAFTAPVPELLKEGSEISDVDNEQATGLQFMGNALYVNVKKGSVSFENDDEFPTFYIILSVFSMDEEGNVTYNFGTANEMYQAEEYGKDNYTLDDVDGANLAYYVGTWDMYSNDYGEDGAVYEYTTTIDYVGQDEETGEHVVKITNLSGYYGTLGLVDELYATWDSSYGLLFLTGQNLENPVTYQGTDYEIGVYPWDPDTDSRYGQANSLIGGITEDGYIAFVNRYSGVNLSGLCYYITDLGWLAKVYYFWGIKVSDETSSVGNLNGQFSRYQEKATVAGSGVLANNYGKIGSGNRGTKLQSAKTVRMVNLSGCKKADKEVELQNIPLK